MLRSLRLLYNLTVMPLAYAVDLLLSIVWCIGHPLYSARLVVYAALNIIHWVGLTFSFLCLLFYWARYTAPRPCGVPLCRYDLRGDRRRPVPAGNASLCQAQAG